MLSKKLDPGRNERQAVAGRPSQRRREGFPGTADASLEGLPHFNSRFARHFFGDGPERTFAKSAGGNMLPTRIEEKQRVLFWKQEC